MSSKPSALERSVTEAMSVKTEMEAIHALRKFISKNPVMHFRNTVKFDLLWQKISIFNRKKLIKEFFPKEWAESRKREVDDDNN